MGFNLAIHNTLARRTFLFFAVQGSLQSLLDISANDIEIAEGDRSL